MGSLAKACATQIKPSVCKFNKEVHGDNSVKQFITRLKLHASDCAFCDKYRDDLTKDRIVYGVNSEETLLTEGNKLILAYPPSKDNEIRPSDGER